MYMKNGNIFVLGKCFRFCLEKFSSIKLILKFSVDSLPIIYFNIFTSPIFTMCFYTLYYCSRLQFATLKSFKPSYTLMSSGNEKIFHNNFMYLILGFITLCEIVTYLMFSNLILSNSVGAGRDVT